MSDRTDSERLDWIERRDVEWHFVRFDESNSGHVLEWYDLYGNLKTIQAASLRAAIDQAMKGEG